MKIKCYSVKLKSLALISSRAYKIILLNGTKVIIPVSQVLGIDADDSNCYWITAWIIDKKDINLPFIKEAWFDENKKRLETTFIYKHVPSTINSLENNIIEELCK